MTRFLLAASIVFGWMSLGQAEDAAAPAAEAPPAARSSQPASSTTVSKLAIGSAIENRELVGEATEFDASVGRLYAWSHVQSAQAPLRLIHRWFLNGTPEADASLNLNQGSGRTWSSKAIRPGSWKVAVVEQNGSIIAETSFTVKEGASAKP